MIGYQRFLNPFLIVQIHLPLIYVMVVKCFLISVMDKLSQLEVIKLELNVDYKEVMMNSVDLLIITEVIGKNYLLKNYKSKKKLNQINYLKILNN